MVEMKLLSNREAGRDCTFDCDFFLLLGIRFKLERVQVHTNRVYIYEAFLCAQSSVRLVGM